MFHTEYRPRFSRQLIGKSQKIAADFLSERAVSRIPVHAVLFIGPSGVGKTTIARIYASLLLCDNPRENAYQAYEPCGECAGCLSQTSIQEINCSSETGIDNVRDIISGMKYMPLQGKYKIYILDEAHGLSKQAQNALLKPVEDCPPHVVFIFCTTEENGILNTLKSRCQIFHLGIPTKSEHLALAQAILKREDSEYDERIAEEIYRASGGNIRSYVQQLEKYAAGALTFVPEEEDDEKVNLAQAIIFDKYDLGGILTHCSKIDDYKGAAASLVAYALKVAQNSNNIGTLPHRRALAIIVKFGDGLPNDAIPKHAFCKRIVEIYSVS